MSSRFSLACLMAIGVASFAAVDDPRSEAPRVAVVDLFQVLREAEPFRKSEVEIRAWIDEQKAALEAMKKDVDLLEAEVGSMSEDSPGYHERQAELEMRKLQFRQMFDARERERLRRIREDQRRSFEDARRAIAEVATARGIDLVLQRRSGEPDGADPAELTSEIYLRDVLYCDESLDITRDVLSILNR